MAKLDEGTILKAYDGMLGPLHLDIELSIEAEQIVEDSEEVVAEIETHYVVTSLSHRIIASKSVCSVTQLISTRHHMLEAAQDCLMQTVRGLLAQGAHLIEREI